MDDNKKDKTNDGSIYINNILDKSIPSQKNLPKMPDVKETKKTREEIAQKYSKPYLVDTIKKTNKKMIEIRFIFSFIFFCIA